jgi:chemotaxis methyl-accepting protein methylase
VNPRLRGLIKRVPGVRPLLRSGFYLTLKSLRHRLVLRLGRRRNYLWTRFFRIPTQYVALSEIVVGKIAPGLAGRPLQIVVVGCSNGAEAYSISSVLLRREPRIDFVIRAYDIDEGAIRQAREGRYSREEVSANLTIDDGLVGQTFDVIGDTYQVRRQVAERVTFAVANALDADLPKRAEPADIVFAQNFLYHLKPSKSRQAFANICRILRPTAALFVDGMDLDLKEELTRLQGLAPLDWRIAEIHDETWKERGWAWPSIYWGQEPFSGSRKGWERRYATIFLTMPASRLGAAGHERDHVLTSRRRR